MNDLLEFFVSSDTMQSLRLYLLMRQYPWLPFAIILIIGVIITMIILLLRAKRANGKQTPPNVRPEPAPFSQGKTDPIPENAGGKRHDPPADPALGSRRLVCTAGALKGKAFAIGRKVCAGRSPHKCQIVFPQDTKRVSGLHCTITFDGQKVSVTDENSSFGTFIDGKRIAPGKACVMHRGQTLSLGSNNEAFVLKGHSAH